jgi:hypothetical protein
MGNIIKMEVEKTECEEMYWMHLAPERVLWRAAVNTIMNLRVP